MISRSIVRSSWRRGQRAVCEYHRAAEEGMGRRVPGLDETRSERKRYVYFWADGIYVNVRLEDERSCLLVIMGATSSGDKELVAVSDGYRESKQSWKELLLDCKSRGLDLPPKLAVGDGALGFWAALSAVFPTTKRQRCGVYKTANILDKMPQSVQGKAKSMIHDIYLAPTKADAEKSYRLFIETFEAKYPKAVECLTKDEDDLFLFYSFPAQHWKHIRTTNPIESTFSQWFVFGRNERRDQVQESPH